MTALYSVTCAIKRRPNLVALGPVHICIVVFCHKRSTGSVAWWDTRCNRSIPLSSPRASIWGLFLWCEEEKLRAALFSLSKKLESAAEFLEADVNLALCMKTKVNCGHCVGHSKKHRLWAVFSGYNKRKHLMFSPHRFSCLTSRMTQSSYLGEELQPIIGMPNRNKKVK